FTFGTYNTLLSDARNKGARLHTYSFGAFNAATGTVYDASAVAIDTFLASDSNRDYMMFVAAGNAGTAGDDTGGYGRANTLSNEAAAKNAVSVGSNNSGTSVSLQGRSFFSSLGPASYRNACSAQTDPVPAASNSRPVQ